MIIRNTFLAISALAAALGCSSPNEQMTTPWTAQVDAGLPLPEYPRPAMVRENWVNLNGKWDYAILPADASTPTDWEGKIVVPFAVESLLSGVERRVGKDSVLWYQRQFEVDGLANGNRCLLHFDASDWRTEVFVNGQAVGTHSGGYTRFSFDITPYLTGDGEILQVKVWDPTDDGWQPRGKQVKKPGGIYYTPVTGIWQTVWLEEVPETYITAYQVDTDIDQEQVTIVPDITRGLAGDGLSLRILWDGQAIVDTAITHIEAVTVPLPNARLWSPESPALYDFELAVMRHGQPIDQVTGYFGMRKVAVEKDSAGIYRMSLNNRPVFQYGPLDQGYWPDGIYTAPTEEALLSDIQTMKNMGFNMVRKHVKVEPQRWYYHCDRLGLLVWQDMPSGYGEIVPVKDHEYSIDSNWLDTHYQDVERNSESEQGFRREWAAIIGQLINHPSIAVWVPFNESWGQFKTNEILRWTKTLDPSRIVDGPSGWIDRGEGELRDYHLYGDRLGMLPLEENRALVIGEFGGLGYAFPGHTYAADAWSYHGFQDADSLKNAYGALLKTVDTLKAQGFAAAVYTQLTDVESEINGLITYDRKQIKIPVDTLRRMHEQLIAPKAEF